MDFKQLKTLYPIGTIQKHKSNLTSVLSLYNGAEYFIIPKEVLSNSEVQLLQSLTIRQERSSPWYDFLYHHILPSQFETKYFQVIHFMVENLHDSYDLWLESFTSFIPDIEEAFFVDDRYGVCIVNAPTTNSELIEGSIATLDDDFGTKTSLFIGINALADNSFPYLYDEERAIFTSNYQSQKVQSFKSLYIRHYLKSSLVDSTYVQVIKQQIYSFEDMETLIRTMWNEQGNITSTAQALFVHRNTLNYRIDKFYELTGLQLRKLDDLLLCYLIIH
ncbi:helix-turn-helix domain-containing protein [Erysipelothrix aquatica]|uniref:helix-turn-helix domain-containing protein n=1 Tax=Erysipelothrix aquatica TaxID=2683714 RepID=UPI0013597A9D|nr:helix-turn-helix domain-containing protein [Erysipelothrix aquatica]